VAPPLAVLTKDRFIMDLMRSATLFTFTRIEIISELMGIMLMVEQLAEPVKTKKISTA